MIGGINMDKFIGTGVVLGSFSPLHKGHMDLILKAKKECSNGVIVAVCGYKKDKGEEVGLPLSLRRELIERAFKYDGYHKDPLVNVIEMNDNLSGIAGYNNHWKEWLTEFSKKIAELNEFNKRMAELKGYDFKIKTDYKFYVGEEEYYEALKENNLQVVLVNRNINPIHATMIRENPMVYWNDIENHFKPYFQRRYLVIGTASEGKTTLVKDLSTYFGCEGTFEYDHEVMENRKLDTSNPPTDCNLSYDDFKSFLDTQFERNKTNKEEFSYATNKLKICDSDAITTLMYANNYSNDDRYALTREDYSRLYEYAVTMNYIADYSRIFILPPHEDSFVQDGTRDSIHADFEARKEQFQILMNLIEEFYFASKIIILDGDFADNFEKAKDIIKGDINE